MSGEDCIAVLLLLGLVLAGWGCGSVVGLENGLARTPPMGWMPFERFRCLTDCVKYPRDCISEQLFKRTADLLVSEGYAQLGYEYLIIDDCWMEQQRDKVTAKLLPDRNRFPSGIKNLADYIHQSGLKFGLYHNIGKYTCMHRGPGARGHFTTDAETFANWSVDYVKLDGCYVKGMDLDKAYPAFGQALNKTGRPMVYSCSWPFYMPRPNYKLIATHCNLWRFATDIRDSIESVTGVLYSYFQNQIKLAAHTGPGHWNDPDMLVLGNYRLSYDASRLQLAMWAVLAAPLIMTNDLETVRPEIKALLQNKDIIEVDQDALGIPGHCVPTSEGIQIWLRPVNPKNNIGLASQAIAFVNLVEYAPCPLCPRTFKVDLNRLGLNNTMGYMVYDLFNTSLSLGLYKPNDTFTTRVNPEGVTFYKFKAIDLY